MGTPNLPFLTRRGNRVAEPEGAPADPVVAAYVWGERFVKQTPIVATQAKAPGQIETPEGIMAYEAGDWIACNVPDLDGQDLHFWPIRESIFGATYSPVPEVVQGLGVTVEIGEDEVLHWLGERTTRTAFRDALMSLVITGTTFPMYSDRQWAAEDADLLIDALRKHRKGRRR